MFLCYYFEITMAVFYNLFIISHKFLRASCSILLKIIDDSFPYFAHEISKVDLTRVFISHWCWNFQEVKLND